jgi:hypothetical protein
MQSGFTDFSAEHSPWNQMAQAMQADTYPTERAGWYPNNAVTAGIQNAGSAAISMLMFAGEFDVAAESSTIAAEGTETFYRTISQANYDTLMATGKLPATSETFISPSLEYAQQYNGVTVQLNAQAGTQNALMGMGVRNSAAGFAGTAYEGLPSVSGGWTSSSAFFKWEGGTVNIGLGNGSALNTFNNNLVNFSLVPKP